MVKLIQKNVDAVMRGALESAKIGHNRELVRTGKGVEFHLHGRAVVTLMGNGDRVILDPKGFPTSTTARAMKDAGVVFGFPDLSASFARGRFRVTYKNHTYLPNQNGRIRVLRSPNPQIRPRQPLMRRSSSTYHW